MATSSSTSEDEDALSWLLTDKEVRLGGQRSVLGLCSWRARRWDLDAAPEPTVGDECVIVLGSPAILIDEYGAGTLDLAAALNEVRSVAGSPGSVRTASGPRSWTRPERVTAWNGIAGVARPVELAVAAGSTAVLKGWTAEALALVARGLGLRREEGFGEVWFLDEKGDLQPTTPRSRGLLTPNRESNARPLATPRPRDSARSSQSTFCVERRGLPRPGGPGSRRWCLRSRRRVH